MVKDFFRLPDGKVARLYTLRNGCGMTARITDFGGCVVDLLVPDRRGQSTDVELGWQEPAVYLGNPGHLGALVGRCANRIGGGRFELDGVVYQSVLNDHGRCTLHGGFGYGKRLWQLESYDEDHLALTLESPDGDAGFPGSLHLRAVYSVDGRSNALKLELSGECDRSTIVNMTTHCYFNLNGESSGRCSGHAVRIAADAVTELDAFKVPTGKVLLVAGSSADLRRFITFESIWERRPDGFDDNFILGTAAELRCGAAQVRSETSGIELTLDTDQVGVQFYMAGGLNPQFPGKSARCYRSGDGFCLEPQGWPDAANHADFPSVRVEPGKPYHAVSVFRFSTF